ncbi:MAG: hypothetical protein EOP20_07105 [Hyphomicrobiales bacterium]|nr:MAG: hypothetical protein EOP20_07105 [Hyphomicrobiales bacterium]
MRFTALSADANHLNPSARCPAAPRGHDDQQAVPKMIKTFSLSALFFLSLGLIFINAAQLPIA